ncbi:hypothetical protein [Nitrosomonas communis]|uniref:hypothetical protein n=1 Tax=Nitrosomonas communis TaxID=44574 RepID=UPI0026F20D47|nr:hypothetical protein [Nitrosomonas communis]MCO6429001.1 hypothetical protein [Nitrosomonas communis]
MKILRSMPLHGITLTACTKPMQLELLMCQGKAGVLYAAQNLRSGRGCGLASISVLEPEVAKAFPKEKAVNEALILLIKLARASTGLTKDSSECS